MKLSKDMCEMALSNDSICSIFNEDYVVLRKTMPVTDDKLNWYISSIRKLKSSGVNIATIIDYKLFPETTRIYKVGSYTEGIFLEERAKGKVFDSSSIYLRTTKDYDFNEVACMYLKMLKDYIEELELRAASSQDIYDKLVNDCLSIQIAGLQIDPKPLNFFFDSKVGYTIIDVIGGDNKSNNRMSEYFPQHMMSIVFGYGKPSMSVEFKDLSVMPPEMADRLVTAGKTLEAKIAVSLRKYGFSDEEIALAISGNRFRYENKLQTVEIDDIEEYIAKKFSEKKDKQNINKNTCNNNERFVISC